jgi:hypothetical protein
VAAVLFLGTPHQGSSYARYANIMAETANFLAIGTQTSRFTGKIRTDLLKSLKTHEAELLRIAEDFRAHTIDIQIRSFVKGTNMKGLDHRVSIASFCHISVLGVSWELILLLQRLLMIIALSLGQLQNERFQCQDMITGACAGTDLPLTSG